MSQQYIPFHVIEKHVIQAVQERGLHHLDVRVAFKDEEDNEEVLKFCSDDARRKYMQNPTKQLLVDLKNDAQGRERFVTGYFVQYKVDNPDTPEEDVVVHTHQEGVEIDLSDLDDHEDGKKKKKGGKKNASPEPE